MHHSFYNNTPITFNNATYNNRNLMPNTKTIYKYRTSQFMDTHILHIPKGITMKITSLFWIQLWTLLWFHWPQFLMDRLLQAVNHGQLVRQLLAQHVHRLIAWVQVLVLNGSNLERYLLMNLHSQSCNPSSSYTLRPVRSSFPSFSSNENLARALLASFPENNAYGPPGL